MKKLLLPSLLLLASCTIAGMDKIPGYEVIALVIGVGACFIMALGFAVTERFHKEHLTKGTPRIKTWMFFAMVLVVFIFLMTLA